MRYRGKPLIPWCHGISCLYRFHIPWTVRGTVYSSRSYSTQQQKPPQSKDDRVDKPAVPIQEHAIATIQNLTDLGKQWGQKSVSTASNTVNYWWERYEEFVGLNEVRYAQSKVTEVRQYASQVYWCIFHCIYLVSILLSLHWVFHDLARRKP